MMNRKIPIWLPRYAALVCALLAGVAVAAVDPARFEVGWPLETPANGQYFDVPLSAEVYRHAPSLEQLAVLDARNEPMPFYRVTVDPPAAVEQRVVLAASPVYASQADGSLAQLSVSSGNGRTALTVTRRPDGPQTEVVAFVVDARNVERAPTAIELDWRALPQPFLLNVRVEQSDDLTAWRAVGRGSVAQLAVGEVEARHARVPVSARAGGYLRIAWERNVPGFYVERVSLVSADKAEAPLLNVRLPALDRAPPRGDTTAGAPEPLYFDAGGALPVAAATVHFAAGSGWLTADVAAADSLDGPWQPVAYRTLLYEVDYGGTHFASPPVAVGRNDKRYWRVTPAEPLGRDRVELELRYPQELLRVAANGTGPYLLAAGTRIAEAGPDATFAAVWRQLDPDAAPAAATVGPMRELGGANALVAPRVFPWRTAALWAVLVAGVVAVGFMAVRLAREMQNKPS